MDFCRSVGLHVAIKVTSGDISSRLALPVVDSGLLLSPGLQAANIATIRITNVNDKTFSFWTSCFFMLS